MSHAGKTLAERLTDRTAIERALREGTRAALIRHKKLGQSIVVWRDGKVVIVPPEKIDEELSRGGEDAPSR